MTDSRTTEQHLMMVWHNPNTGELFYPQSYVDKLIAVIRAADRLDADVIYKAAPEAKDVYHGLRAQVTI